jgi:hypothetical protein
MDEESESQRAERRGEEYTRKHALFQRNEGVGELRELSDEELRERDDAVAFQMERFSPTVNYARRLEAYRAELSQREAERQGKKMEKLTRSINRLTRWIVGLTVLIAVATIIGVALTAWTLLSGG